MWIWHKEFSEMWWKHPFKSEDIAIAIALDNENAPDPVGCGECQHIADESDGPEYGPPWYECSHKRHISNLKWFPFRVTKCKWFSKADSAITAIYWGLDDTEGCDRIRRYLGMAIRAQSGRGYIELSDRNKSRCQRVLKSIRPQFKKA